MLGLSRDVLHFFISKYKTKTGVGREKQKNRIEGRWVEIIKPRTASGGLRQWVLAMTQNEGRVWAQLICFKRGPGQTNTIEPQKLSRDDQ